MTTSTAVASAWPDWITVTATVALAAVAIVQIARERHRDRIRRRGAEAAVKAHARIVRRELELSVALADKVVDPMQWAASEASAGSLIRTEGLLVNLVELASDIPNAGAKRVHAAFEEFVEYSYALERVRRAGTNRAGPGGVPARDATNQALASEAFDAAATHLLAAVQELRKLTMGSKTAPSLPTLVGRFPPHKL